MTESTELTKKTCKKLIKAGNKLIDYGETAYEENEFGALVAHRTPSKELLALVKVTTEAIAEAKLEWQSQLRKEMKALPTAIHWLRGEDGKFFCSHIKCVQKEQVLNLLQETK